MKTFLKVMREIKENGKYVTMFNNKVHKREWVKQCFMYEEMIERLVAQNVTNKLLGVNPKLEEFRIKKLALNLEWLIDINH